VVDGRLIEGSHSHGAMSGHITIDVRDDARICPCGQPGHLEAYVSGVAPGEAAVEFMEDGRKTSLNSRIESGAMLTPLVIAEEAAAGDALSLELVLDTARYLAVGNCEHDAHDRPGCRAVGGGINFGGPDSPLGRRYLDAIREEVSRRHSPFRRSRQQLIMLRSAAMPAT